VKFYEGWKEETSDKYVFVSEYCPEGSLEQEYWKRYEDGKGESYPEGDIMIIAYCILQGLEFLHKMNFTHRLLHMSNIVYAEGRFPKISDYCSLRHILIDPGKLTPTEKVIYLPNEIKFKKKKEELAQNVGSFDIYSLGVILYQLCFMEDTVLQKEKDILEKLKSKSYREGLLMNIGKMIQQDEALRPTAQDLLSFCSKVRNGFIREKTVVHPNFCFDSH